MVHNLNTGTRQLIHLEVVISWKLQAALDASETVHGPNCLRMGQEWRAAQGWIQSPPTALCRAHPSHLLFFFFFPPNWWFLLVTYFSLSTKGITTICLLLSCVCIWSWNDHLLFIKLCRDTHKVVPWQTQLDLPRSSTQSFFIQLSGSQLGHLAINGNVILAAGTCEWTPGLCWTPSRVHSLWQWRILQI